jgi:hypothetical protein
MSGSDRLMFLKIKRGKLGPTDPRTILTDEASRLEQADGVTMRKVKERSEVLDEQVSIFRLQIRLCMH